MSDSYHQLPVDSLDITAISFKPSSFFSSPLSIFSIYNPPNSNSSIARLRKSLEPIAGESTILVGDFNKHHPLWTGSLAPARTASSDHEELIQILADFNLECCLPAATPTFHSDAHDTYSTLDLVFCSEDLTDALLSCTTGESHGSDHFTVRTMFDISLKRTLSKPRRQHRAGDWERFAEMCEEDFGSAPIAEAFTSAEDIDKAVEHIESIMSKNIGRTVPTATACPYAKRWWTRELTDLRQKFNAAQRAAQKDQTNHDKCKEMRIARNKYHAAIRQSKRRHWKEWVEAADETSVYQASKYAHNPAARNCARTPTLRNADGSDATTCEAKCSLLKETFFPPAPAVNLADIQSFEIPDPVDRSKVTAALVQEYINSLAPYKASGPRDIPNVAIKTISHLLSQPLASITNACIENQYFPRTWRRSTTITIRKPGKDNYALPGAYRPIALEENLGKVVEGVVGKMIANLAESNHLLPENHFGGRAGRTTTDAVHLLVHRVKDAWRKGHAASMLLLDISQAFPTVCHDRLIHNLRKRRIPENIAGLIASFLKDRQTSLHFDDYESPLLPTPTGIPQGSPLSPILYLFYSADLLEVIDRKRKDAFSGGFIDDTMMVATGPTVESNIATLSELTPQILRWSTTHACKFDIKKFKLVHLTRNKKFNTTLPLQVGTTSIAPVDSAKYLGVIIDQKLRWKEQAEAALKKGTKSLMACNRLSRPTFGLPHKFIRQLYITVVLPRAEYALSVFYEPIRKRTTGKSRQGSVGLARQFDKLQRLAARLIAGGFRTTSTDMLIFHADLPPSDLRLNRSCHSAAVRLATLPATHPLHKHVARVTKCYPRRHRSPLHELFAAFPDIRNMETILPVMKNPNIAPFLSFKIAPSRDESIKDAQKLEYTSTCIYTDGSGFEEGAGAAAVCPSLQLPPRLFHLGPTAHHTVFEAECVGIILALDTIRAAPATRQRFSILLDNQAAIQAIQTRRTKSGQHLIDTIHRETRLLLNARPRTSIHIAWISGHSDVQGNEWADEEAKNAAQGESSGITRKFRVLARALPRSASAIKASFKKRLEATRVERWRASPAAAKLSRHDKDDPGRRIRKMYEALPRRSGSILTQLRTEHVGLNGFLARIKATSSSRCPECNATETVQHYLLICRRFLVERDTLRRSLKLPLSLPLLLNEPKSFGPLFQFINSTNRFPLYYDNPATLP